MEPYEQILLESVTREIIPKLHIDGEVLAEMKCYQAICKIREVLSDEALDDLECFMKIEEIVCALDELGIGGGGRHDF